VLIERSPKKYPSVGDIWCAITDSPEALHQGVSLHKDANLGIWTRTTAFPKDFRELECEQSALAMESAAATAVALATPTKEPLRATKVVGVPLLPGTLELDGCTPEANCVALVTETPPGKNYLWCVVLQRDDKLVPGIFLKMTETAATGQSATVEDMRRQGCTVAPAMLDGTQPDSAADARAAIATPPADEIPIGDPPIDDSALDPAVSADLIGIPFRASASASAPPGVNACNQRISYDPALVHDGQLDTAWRVPGDGKGQFLRLDLAAPTLITELSLVPGYAKVDPCDGVNRFTQNRRVRKVRLSFSDGSSVEGSFTDAPTLQPVHFAPVRTSWVQISILETYPQPAGSAGRDFTPISEVVLGGWCLASRITSDDFEAETLNPANWLISNQGVGTVAVNGDAPYAGSNSVFIGQKVVGFTTTALILSIAHQTMV